MDILLSSVPSEPSCHRSQWLKHKDDLDIPCAVWGRNLKTKPQMNTAWRKDTTKLKKDDIVTMQTDKQNNLFQHLKNEWGK